MTQGIAIELRDADALSVAADVLALKYARDFHGADRAAAERLRLNEGDFALPAGAYRFVPSRGELASEAVLFVGVPPLYLLDYQEVRTFARRVLEALAADAPNTRRLVVTLHGPNFGLDESESFRAEIAGFLDAIEAGAYPPALAGITIAELDAQRVARLQKVLHALLPAGRIESRDRAHLRGEAEEAVVSLRGVGHESRVKPIAFVAMPFDPEYDDHFHYGIQGAAHASGFLCERADLASFTGDVMDWVKNRIDASMLVIADLTAANPNVYLEVGYAWGRRIPTVLLVRDTSELKFDVRGQRCLVYSSIRNLENLLQHELTSLLPRLRRRSLE